MKILLDGAEVEIELRLKTVQAPVAATPSSMPGEAVRRLDHRKVEEYALAQQGWGDEQSLVKLALGVIADMLDGKIDGP